MTARRSNGLGPLILFAAASCLVDLWTPSTGKLPRDLALAVADEVHDCFACCYDNVNLVCMALRRLQMRAAS